MQRRAAALYAAFFLVLSLASYGMIATASPPTVSVDDPDHRVASGGEFQLAGRTYGVSVDAEAGSATISWVNRSAVHTATWEADATVALGGTNFSVATEPDASPARVVLTEVRPLGDVTTTELDGTEYVVLGEGETRELVPVDAYLDDRYGPAETRTITVGEVVRYEGNRTRLATVDESSATLRWTAPATRSASVAEGETVTLARRTFVAHFPDDRTLVLDRDLEAYEDELAVQDTYDERINGLWGVSILSALAVVVLLAFAYLPSRY